MFTYKAITCLVYNFKQWSKVHRGVDLVVAVLTTVTTALSQISSLHRLKVYLISDKFLKDYSNLIRGSVEDET